MEILEQILWKDKLNHWQYNLDELIDYIKELAKECSGKLELNKRLGVYEGFLDSLIKKHNLNLNLEYKYKPNDARFKAIYQNYDWCYQKFIIEGLNHDEMAKEVNCSKRVIEKWCTEKHKLTQKYRQIHKQLNNIQNDLIIGSMLGDGHIDKRETQPMFIVSHAEDQKDYLFWKYDILKDLCNTPPVEKPEAIRYFSEKGYLCQKQYRFCTRIYDCLKSYRSMSYKDLLKLMNKFSFCIWMLDDASRDRSNWILCIAEYTQEEISYAIKIFENRFDLNAWQQKDKRYVVFDSNSSRKIDNIMLKNIPNNLDIIQNKIINNNTTKSPKRILINIEEKDILLSDYCKENNLNYSKIINRTYKGIDIYESINKERGNIYG